MISPAAEAGRHNLGWALMRDAVRDTPDAVAIRQDDLRLTYAELDDRIARAATVLAREGVRAGDAVALLFPNDHRYLEALFAVMRLGAVAVPLNTRAGRTALVHALDDSRPVVLVAHHRLADLAGELSDAAEVRPRILEPLDGTGQPRTEVVAVSADDICFRPYTSGTTGKPKGCLLTHGGQLWNATATRDVWEIAADDRGLVAAPLYHKNAMICVVKPCLLAGATIVIATDPSPATMFDEVARHRCTYTTGVPATYEMAIRADTAGADLSSLRFAVCGSAPLTEESGERISAALGVPVIEAYGLTEGAPQVLANPRHGWRRGSAGRPTPGGEVKVMRVDGAEPVDAQNGEVGELWVRNPGVTRGYANLPEVTAERITPDGWLRTGDLARRTDDDFFYIMGRRDEMMSVGGENVYPGEVERVIAGLAEVDQVAVVPAPHPVKGQVPVAFVVAAGLTEDDVKQHSLRNGAPYAHPRRVFFVDELPVGGTGKIDKALLTARAEEAANE